MITGYRTWIVGDSLVRRAGEGNIQLTGGGEVTWLGLGGARILGLPSRLNRCLSGRSPPHTLIIHLGSNDILKMPKKELSNAIAEALKFIRQRLPNCRIVWSSILPRLFWYGELTPGAGERVRMDVNGRAAAVCRSLSGDNRVLWHPAFVQRDHSNFYHDGVHLSSRGNDLFRRDMELGLQHFNRYSRQQALHFPPN